MKNTQKDRLSHVFYGRRMTNILIPTVRMTGCETPIDQCSNYHLQDLLGELYLPYHLLLRLNVMIWS